MDRRQYLLSVGSGAGVVTAGCLGDDPDREGLSVEGSAPTLSAGGNTVISGSAYNADSFRFWPPEIADLSMTETNVSPSPDEQADSFPPIWVWDEPKSVIEAELDVTVGSDVDTGEYTYGITARNGTKQQRAEYTIIVDN